jgi:peptide/histidine transporter 3/4
MVYRFLDKACVKTNTGGEGDGPWSVCSAAKVEETKIVLRMLPLVFSSTVAHVSSSLLIAFTVQQGATTNTKLGKVHVYPAMLFIIPSIFQTLMLVAYDRLLFFSKACLARVSLREVRVGTNPVMRRTTASYRGHRKHTH